MQILELKNTIILRTSSVQAASFYLLNNLGHVIYSDLFATQLIFFMTNVTAHLLQYQIGRPWSRSSQGLSASVLARSARSGLSIVCPPTPTVYYVRLIARCYRRVEPLSSK
jgi:hypothetical protein